MSFMPNSFKAPLRQNCVVKELSLVLGQLGLPSLARMRKYCKTDAGTSVLKTLNHTSTTTNEDPWSSPALVASILLLRQPTPETRRLSCKTKGVKGRSRLGDMLVTRMN